ncbi:hypothetical protein GCM10008024_14520 [Allgaiera indica]|uniref:Mutator family transposase n=1 Tax=Allgaiera indica TaxID=765699 RepID=A0AAN4ZYV2_9RHOB|nr:hypothetical protein GCM10008024_14520 [Allgaiera indica]
MKRATTSALALASRTEMTAAVEEAWEAVGASFEQFCLVAGLSSLTQMLEEDARELAGEAHARDAGKPGYRWGRTTGRVGFHGGKVAVERPRVRSKTTGKELARGRLSRLAGAMGDEPDADQCLDAEVRSCGAPAGGRGVGSGGIRAVEVGGLAAVQGTDGGAAGRVDGDRPVTA